MLYIHIYIHAQSLRCVQFFAIPWTVAFVQAPLSLGFSRQEYWSGLPCPPPRDHPDSGIKPMSIISFPLAGRSLPPVPPEKPIIIYILYFIKYYFI